MISSRSISCSWFVAIILFLVVTTKLSAFPENTRLGYGPCSSCHISPTGGGVLKQYGKGLSEELSTWSYEGEGKPFHGLSLLSWLNIGSDTRYLYLKGKNQDLLKFTMQSEVELAVEIKEGVYFGGTIGRYGREQNVEYRRNYMLININDWVSLRTGRFFPGFGLNLSDHTKLIRQTLGFDEGGETHNIELSIRNEKLEVFLTYSLGQIAEIKTNKNYTTYKSNEKAIVSKLATFLVKNSTLGLNLFNSSQRNILGVYAILGLPKSFYLLLEADTQKTKEDRTNVNLANLGYEIYRGIHLNLEGQSLYTKPTYIQIYSAGLTLYPRPHFELVFRYDYRLTQDKIFDQGLFLFHYYL